MEFDMQATRKSVVDYVKKLMKEGNESPIHGWVMSEILSKVSKRYEDSEEYQTILVWVSDVRILKNL
jgi:hypothetical protein